jgi:hypothetical protein
MKVAALNMKWIIMPGLLLWLFGCSSKPPVYTTEAERLLDLEKEAIQREFQNDTTYLSSIMDTTFIELLGDKIKNKHEVLKTMFQNNIDTIQNKITLDSFLLEDPVIHLYNNTAVVTFVMHTFRKKEAVAFERRTRFYDVWVKRGDQWKAVTWQASSVD